VIPEQSESELIRRAREGDGEAFRILCAGCESMLRNRIRRELSPALRPKLSESDILQEGYLVAVRRLDEFEDRGDGSFGRWLERIVQLRAKAAVRYYVGAAKRSIRREVSRRDGADTPDLAGGDPTPSQMAMADELLDRVVDALDGLPDDYRDVVRLLQIERVTLEEAAKRMERSVPALRKLYGRALDHLAEALGLRPR
jgi:RNA polymerase sigma-70 factor (ECF subfamily)